MRSAGARACRINPCEDNGRDDTMSQQYASTYDVYLAAWSNISADERRELLNQSVSERVVFTNPQRYRSGKPALAEHLEGFQRRSPDGSFRMNNMLGWDRHALAEWQFVGSDEAPGFSGYDVLTFDGDGLISEILLFGNVEAQKLAWRRRDPVALAFTK
jgi:hypothetical protein